MVVPRRGYVDRNVFWIQAQLLQDGSYPARGTWIEISSTQQPCRRPPGSYPARGTWIEIIILIVLFVNRAVVPRTGYVDRNMSSMVCLQVRNTVVPRTGYVDRNITDAEAYEAEMRRTPHGVRG